MYPPDDLLTSGFHKHDVEHNPHIIAPDPFASDDCLDVFSLEPPFPPPEPEELNTMNPSEDEPSSGLNGRLRPRRTTIPSPVSIKPILPKLDGKPAEETHRLSNTPSKASPAKPEDLSIKSNLFQILQFLCPYCDRKFGSKQNVSKHIRRLHLSASKPDSSIFCLFCNQVEPEPGDIIRHMVDSHPNHYFACLECHTRFPSTKELAEHKLNICEKQKISYRTKLRRKTTKKNRKSLDSHDKEDYASKNYSGHGFNGIVISCELKPSHVHDDADIEDNITTNLILPPSKNITASTVLEKNAVIVLDDIQWNRRIPSNFSFHNADADQILSRLGVVHRSPKTGEPSKREWFKAIEDATQKFEKCFDTSFYSKVASNVHENLTKFLDGSFNFNPDPENTIKTRKSKNSVVINTVEGFPILLACEQYSRNTFDGYMPRSVAPKHKWKWDNLETDKPWNPDQLKRDTHANNCIITLVSSLDIWTQLCMRRKFEDKFNITPVEKKTEKKTVIGKELKEILESRQIPSINSQVVKYLNSPLLTAPEQDFPTTLGLMPSTTRFNVKPAILSGEWVRPRCYVCCACGAQSRDSRALSLHVSSHHPNSHVQHYEVVGESLLKADILQHLYVPPCQNFIRTRPPRGIRDCTKCNDPIAIEDLHQHMLDCAGDTPAVRRKCRYRPFGVRRRRPRLPDNRIRKKMRNDLRTRQARQKNLLRSKPKNRSEVGDAETIRKMLADLPAKRHRVLVNPLHSILRPRIKLDKQRAILMMKRHTLEEAKIGKSKTSNNNIHDDISPKIDRYQNVPSRDDEDNMPLKPRLKRVVCKIARQKESLNRKVVLKKPIRKVCSLVEKKENDSPEIQLDETISCPVELQNDELSLDHNEERINLNSDPQNIREHASGSGDSNNGQRDNQQPGGNEDNANAGNDPPPIENIPLKHSIARLTATSGTHDKAVQFHQLFLIQQECNNTNKHVPTGQRVFFENEAVVMKLDKPPLHFDPNICLEPIQGQNEDLQHSLESVQNLDSSNQNFDSMQKNKLNKPRKGLNDCIAMLKNKLVDTDPNAPVHVSVQCGTDDPIGPEPVHLATTALMTPRADVLTKSVQATPRIERPKKASPKSIIQNEQLLRPSPLYRGPNFNYDIHGNINSDNLITQWRPVPYETFLPGYIDNRTRRESTRRRTTSQHENIFLAQHLLRMTPPHDDMLMKMSSESYDAYNLLPRKNLRNCPEQLVHVVGNNNMFGKYGKQNFFDRNLVQTSSESIQSCRPVLNHVEKNKRSLDSNKKSTRTRITTPRKSVESLEKNIPTRKELPKSTKNYNENYRKRTIDYRPHQEFTIRNSEERKSEIYPQVMRRKRSSTVNTEVHLTPLKQVEPQFKVDMNVKIPQRIYTEHYNDNQVSIPPAHASTNIESILPMPLDLSGKTLTADYQYSFQHDAAHSYETLDLSKKRRTMVVHQGEDEVVDLRVKHTPQYSISHTYKPPNTTTSQQDTNIVTPLNLVHLKEVIPTDLSLKRVDKDTNAWINLSHKNNPEESQIQDLSKTVSNEDSININEELPTDLSYKNIVNVEPITLSPKDCNKNETYEIQNKGEVLKVLDKTNDSPEIVNDDNHDNFVIEKITDTELQAQELEVNVDDNINNEDKTHDSMQTNVSYNSTDTILKPIYDPTLRIPQYKLRPTEVDSIYNENNNREAVSSPVMSTSVENYSSHQVPSRFYSTTETNNSMLTPIDVEDRITYSFTNSMLNTAVSSVSGSMNQQPVYSLLNHAITTPFTKYESTRPVYALPKACISMAKIDTTTNNLLSIPSTTIISTTPVYTLAGTTITTPLNYATLPITGHSIPYPPPCGTYMPDTDNQIMTNYTSSNSVTQDIRTYDDDILIRGTLYSFERDHDIMRKLTMLPKDIVAILKTMPVHLRNQLLDVLPLYLSASRPKPILCTQTPLFNKSLSTILLPTKLSNELALDASTDTVDIKPVQFVEDGCHLHDNVDSRDTLLQSCDPHMHKLHLNDQVIDLTHDEVVSKVDMNSEDVDEQLMPTKEETPASIATTSTVQKTTNDKTASLRAVRIKAPSERQKLKIISNPLQSLSSPEIQCMSSNEIHDNELFQYIEADKFSDIQMYEVSSTQSNKNKNFNGNITIIDTSPAPQFISDNVNHPHSLQVGPDLIEQEHAEKLNPLFTRPNHADNATASDEIKDISKVTENKNLYNTSNDDNVFDPNLNEIYNNNSTIPITYIQDKCFGTYNINILEDADDSEDDVSLAVIVKQKQQKLNDLKLVPQLHLATNTFETNLETSDTTDALCYQLSKQTYRVTDYQQSNDKMLIETSSSETHELNQNVDGLPLVTTKIQHIVKNDLEEKSKQFNKKGKKNLRFALRVNDVKLQDAKEIKIKDCEIYINKDSDNLCKSNGYSEENYLTTNLNEHPNSLIENEIDFNVKTKESVEVDISITPTVHDEFGVANENVTNNINDLEHVEQNRDIQNNENLLESQEEIPRSTIQQITTFEEPAVKEYGVNKDYVDLVDSSILNNTKIMHESSDTVLRNCSEDEIGLALRRGRRGKSLFVEGKEQVALICSEAYSEQKVPLTKKQLIFSKLLLDEENNLKRSLDHQSTIVENNNSHCSSKLEEVLIEENNKPVKRKKSQVSKKKSKKKKSIDDSEQTQSAEEEVFVTDIKRVKKDSGCRSNVEGNIQSNHDLNREKDLSSNTAEPKIKLLASYTNALPFKEIKMIDQHQNKKAEPGSSVKRKLALSTDSTEGIYTKKAKKTKSNNRKDIMTTSDTSSSDDSNYTPTNHRLSLAAARRTRSKSIVVKTSATTMYDPYDIDLEDMGDKTEPFRTQKLNLLRSANLKSTQENNVQLCTMNRNVAIDLESNSICINTTNAVEKSRDAISDSDESTKSDVPLKKYIEDKERKNKLSAMSSKAKHHHSNEGVETNKKDKKQRKKHKKKKRSVIANDKVQKDEKDTKEMSEEQLRSEQFMESFGFFSERKPRKSNLLAMKKISETFHNIANESDDACVDSKQRPSRKTCRNINKPQIEVEKEKIKENEQVEDEKEVEVGKKQEEEDEKEEEEEEEEEEKAIEIKYVTPANFAKVPVIWDKNLKLRAATRYCHICKKEFRRTDNLVRHQMSLLHVTRLSETDPAARVPVPDEPNYLVVFKQHMDRLKILEHKMKIKKNSKSKFTLPSLQEILVDVTKAVNEQHLARRTLSRDQALFLDCCELLKDSNRAQGEERSVAYPIIACCPSSYALACVSPKEYDPNSGLSNDFYLYNKSAPTLEDLNKKPIIHTSARFSGMPDFVPLSSRSKQASDNDPYALPCTSASSLPCNLDNTVQDITTPIIGDILDDKDDSKSDGDVDSITAQNILDSEEVRNLENDLLSGLKEAACKFQPLPSVDKMNDKSDHEDLINNSGPQVSNSPEPEINMSEKTETATKVKNIPESKEKKNLDIPDTIDIFEDKFDKIKRKCRSQAAAAKLVQTTVEPSVSHKRRKKSEKKKGKKSSKKSNRNTVLTKGALKGYDSIKVSISTSEINMSAIIPPVVNSTKKKRKSGSKKKRDKKKSALTRKLDANDTKESTHKNIDVYEFSENEEPEVFELRPSTVMERFRNLNNKDKQLSTKAETNRKEAESSDSVSDGDDFVYMSDDYVCSDGETENSLLSCELSNVKGNKPCSPLKRKDVLEKNAVMGKIFKNNAVRSEKKSMPLEETTEPKADLDVLFDSLLEGEHKRSVLLDKAKSPKSDSVIPQKKRVFSPVVLSKYDLKSNKGSSPKRIRSPSPALSSDSAASKRINSFSSQQSSPRRLSPNRYITSPFKYEPSTSKTVEIRKKFNRFSGDYEYSLKKKYDTPENENFDRCTNEDTNKMKTNDDSDLSPTSDEFVYNTFSKTTKEKTVTSKKDKTTGHETAYEFKADCYDDEVLSDDAGVARQRVRRKCTVGKQNILAETWSSESEPDSVPPRPNSAESVALGVARKRKGRKREGQITGGKKGNKHVSVKNRVFDSRVTSDCSNIGVSSSLVRTGRSGGSSSTSYTQKLSLPGPSGIGPRIRPNSSFWAADDEEPEHVQQHGWIVGDSHKKLVTMLAHAKGRKRNNDDKHLIE